MLQNLCVTQSNKSFETLGMRTIDSQHQITPIGTLKNCFEIQMGRSHL